MFHVKQGDQMHVTRGPSGLEYYHDGDFSGSVTVEIPVLPDDHWSGEGERASVSHQFRQAITQRQVVEVEIPFADIKHLVLAYLRQRAISFLELADDATLTERAEYEKRLDDTAKAAVTAMRRFLRPTDKEER